MSQPLEYEQITYNSPDGAQMGRSSVEKVAFYGSTPVVQRANATQAVLTVSAASGLMATFFSLSQGRVQDALTQGQISSVDIAFSGAPQISSADLLIVNKWTPDRGHGICNARISAAASVATYARIVLHQVNASGATLNSSPDQIMVAAIRGFVNSVTMSPPVVGANSTTEYQVTVTGVATGMVVPISKPTDQASLGIAGTRVISNNVLGITFLNTGNSSVTPTASEVYQYAGLAGIASTVNIMSVGIFTSVAGYVSGVSNNSVSFQDILVTGIQSTDQILGTGASHQRETYGLNLIAARVTANNVVALAWLNSVSSIGAANKLTPVVENTHVLPILRPVCEAPMTMYQVSLAPTAVGVSTSVEQSFTVTGLTVSTAVFVSKPSYTTGIGIVGYRISAANTLGITFVNPTNASITPPTETYLVANFRPVLGTGHYVQQIVSPLAVCGVTLTNEMRNALAGLGLIAGA